MSSLIPEHEGNRRALYRAVLSELVGVYPFPVNREDLDAGDFGLGFPPGRRGIAGAIIWLEHRGLCESEKGGVNVWATMAAAEAARLLV